MIAKITFYILLLLFLSLPLLLIKSQEGKIKCEKGKMSFKIGILGYVMLSWILLILLAVAYAFMNLSLLQEFGSDEHMRKMLDNHMAGGGVDLSNIKSEIILSTFLSTVYVLGWAYSLIYLYVFKAVYFITDHVFIKRLKKKS